MAATPSGPLRFSVAPGTRGRVGRAEAGVLFADLGRVSYTSVALGGCSIGDGGAAVVAQLLSVLAKKWSLRTLSLADVVATLPEDEAVRTLSTLSTAAAEAKTTLLSLDLSYNALGSKGVCACAPLLEALAPTLAHLYLKRAGLGPDAMRLLRTFLISGQATTRLRTLHVTSAPLGEKGVGHIAAVVAKSPQVEDLRLTSLRAGSAGTDSVLKAVAACGGNLRSLDLSDNDLTLDTALLFPGVLQANPKLTTLALRDMAMGDDAAYLVLRAVTKSAVELAHLDLAGNDLGPGAGPRLVAAFKARSSALVSLSLSDNPLGDDAAVSVCRALAGTTPAESLSDVRLVDCDLSDLGVVEVVDALRALPALTRLELSGSKLREGTREAVNAALGDKLILKVDDEDEIPGSEDSGDVEGETSAEGGGDGIGPQDKHCGSVYERELAAALDRLSGPVSRSPPPALTAKTSSTATTKAPPDASPAQGSQSSVSSQSFWSRFAGGSAASPDTGLAAAAQASAGPTPPRTPPSSHRGGASVASVATPLSSERSASMVSSARQLRAQVVSLDREVGELMQELQPGGASEDTSLASIGGSFYSATNAPYPGSSQVTAKNVWAELMDVFWACIIASFFLFIIIGIVQSQDEMTFTLRPV